MEFRVKSPLCPFELPDCPIGITEFWWRDVKLCALASHVALRDAIGIRAL
jgi:hypothetical protein